MICSTNQLTGFCMMATLRFNELNRFYKMKTDEQYLEALVGRCQRLFFNKVAGLRPGTLLKKSLWHRSFPVNFAKFLRTSSFTEHLRWLLLNVILVSLHLTHFMSLVPFYTPWKHQKPVTCQWVK